MNTLNLKIPVPPGVVTLADMFHKAGYELRVVGGAVRDFLMAKSEPKDVDLATNARPEQIREILDARRIPNRPQGEAFGVWIARIQDIEYEIATYRADGVYSDGRRPDSVEFCDAEMDYRRRDLTINALYYDPIAARVFDYGTGIEDIAARRVRTIGSPRDRFSEDRLRVLRLVRFFHRYSENEISLDEETTNAVLEYRQLVGVSPPRIYQELASSVKSTLNVRELFHSYVKFDLLSTIFPGVSFDLESIERFKTKNMVVLTAGLLQKETPQHAWKVLNDRCWANEVNDEVRFLLNLLHAESDDVPLWAVKLTDQRRRNVAEFSEVMGVDPKGKSEAIWKSLQTYEPITVSGDTIMREYGVEPGPEIGKIQRRLYHDHFFRTLSG